MSNEWKVLVDLITSVKLTRICLNGVSFKCIIFEWFSEINISNVHCEVNIIYRPVATSPPPPPPRYALFNRINSSPCTLIRHIHLVSNFLNFHMILILIVDMGCGARSHVPHGFEIRMFNFFKWSWYFNVYLVNSLDLGAALLYLILDIIYRNTDFGVWGNEGFFYKREFKFMAI